MVKISSKNEYTLFLASPNDMGKYRSLVPGIIKSVNDNLRREKECLRLKTFENDVYSAYGKDPQWIINEQLGDDHDIVLLIFGSRIGTQTPRSISGTVEEFQKAVDRFSNTGVPNIMIYLCKDRLNPWKIDPDQLKKLRKFIDSIKPEGLFKYFQGEKDFRKHLLNDLNLFFDEKINQAKDLKKPTDIRRLPFNE